MKMKWQDITTFHPDRVSGLVLGAIGVFLIYKASPLPVGHLNAPDSGFFPIILAALLIVLSVTLVVRSFRTEAVPLEMTTRSWAVLFGAAGFLLYALLLERVGFLICTMTAIIVLMKAYGGLSWKLCLAIGVPMVLAAYAGFGELGVPLPRGILGFY